jgi:hypothetical protein
MLKELRMFISSPGDVLPHRETVEQLIESLNHDPLVASHCRLTAVSWSRKGAAIPISANQTSQWSISEYLASPGDCDLTIVLFWRRLGTPLPPNIRRSDDSGYQSGTVWEIEHALHAGKPVWIYRKKNTSDAPEPPVGEHDRQQIDNLNAYLAQAKNADGSINFGLNRFDNDDELRTKLTQQLRWFISARLSESSRVNIDGVINSVPNSTARKESKGNLYPLARYPIGPMIRDILILHLPEVMAEAAFDKDPRALFGQINNTLKSCRAPGEPELRMSMAEFSTERGPKIFWGHVLHGAALRGPRVLACVLSLFSHGQFDDQAREEFFGLVEKVNHYV